MAIKVVKVNREQRNFTRYIGREWAGLPQSPYHNPFHIRNGTREECILRFANYWYAPEQKWLREKALHEILENDILGCWCFPLACHGDIIAGYITWKRQDQRGGHFYDPDRGNQSSLGIHEPGEPGQMRLLWKT